MHVASVYGSSSQQQHKNLCLSMEFCIIPTGKELVYYSWKIIMVKETLTQYHLEGSPLDYKDAYQLVEVKQAKIGRDKVMKVAE